MHRFISVAAFVVATSAAASLSAQSQTYNFDIDAQVGVQALEEPVKGAVAEGAPSNETNTYVRLDAGVLAQLSVLQLYLAAPLRFDVDGFKLRARDWDETHEVLRTMRCIRFDYMRSGGSMQRYDEDGACETWTPDENVGAVSSERADFRYASLRLNPINNYSLGYGAIIDGFTADLAEDDYVTGLGLDVNINRTFVVSGILSDITRPNVVGGRLAARPLQRGNYQWGDDGSYGSYESDTSRQLFLELAGTAITDLTAPITQFNPETSTFETGTDNVTVVGGEIRVRTDRESVEYMHDYKVTRFEFGAQYNHIIGFDGGGHGHARIYHDVGWVDFYIDGEYRYMGANYIPRYFDQHYSIQRSQYLLSTAQREGTNSVDRAMTKRDALGRFAGRGQHGYASQARFRFWLPSPEGDGWRRFSELRFFVEGVPARAQANSAGVELSFVNIKDKLDIMGRFAQQGWDTPGEIFQLQNSLLTVNATYDLTDELYLITNYDKSWFLLPTGDFETTNNFGINLGVRY